MYVDYFGFSQQPFSIAPDPRFLFLSPRHHEALQHLRHGLTSSGGFLLLTGEVGTGKTTLSRAILAELSGDLDVVFILNPKLSERELLAAIAEGFGISGCSEHDSLKVLTDALSGYLMQAAQQGRHPVVLIDEAQHLYPSVLEQLRLLTNLETDARKLLSVVLIGQPELNELLQQSQLRQVAQRIVARYQLLPFTREETDSYLNHRLEVVGASGELFDTASRRRIWHYTQGTPRLINLLCDRTLQLAALRQQRQITSAMVDEASAALPHSSASSAIGSGAKRGERSSRYFLSGKWATGALLILSLVGGSWFFLQHQQQADGQSAAPELVFVPEVAKTPSMSIEGLSVTESLQRLAHHWQLGAISFGERPCERLERYNLHCAQLNAGLESVLALRLPALVEMHDGSIITVLGHSEQQILVADRWGKQWLAKNQLQPLLSEQALVLVPKASFFNDTRNQAWSQWLSSALAELVPLPLRQAEQERQRQWLEDSSRAYADDDSWLYAVLFANSESYEPVRGLFYTDITEVYRDEPEYAGDLEQVRYPERSLRLSELGGSEIAIEWPSFEVELVENLVSEPAPTPVSESAERVASVREPSAETSEPETISDTLRVLFEDAVRSVPPPVEPTEWGFDLDLPRDNRQNNSDPTEIITTDATLPWLVDLAAEQRGDLPDLSYDQHNYRGTFSERWIVLGNQRLREGESIQGIRVISIRPTYSIFAQGDLLFRVEALEGL